MPTPDTGIGPGWSSPLPTGGTSTTVTAPAPTAGDAYDAAKAQAQKRIDDLEQQRTALLSSLTSAPYTEKDRITQQIRSLETALAGAYRDAAVTARASAAAATKAAVGPNGMNPVAYMKADADSRRADAMETRAAAYAEGTAAKRQQLEADSRLKDADANVAQAKADMAAATAPDEIARAHVALQQATATLQSTQEANKAAGYSTDILAAKAAVAPEAAKAEVAKTTTETGKTAAETQQITQITPAQVENYVAQGLLSRNQADAIKQKLPYDIEQLVAQGDLTQAQAAAIRSRTPAEIGQLQATTEATQAGTQKGLLGTMYGLQDRVKVIADMIRSGQITDPAQGKALLDDYVQTNVQGTTPFERNKALLDTETQRRQQDYSLAASQGSTYTSGLSSAMSTFGKLNDTTPVGSDAAGRGFLATMGMLGNQLQSFKPPPGVMDSPLMASMRGPAMPAPAAPAPGPGEPGHTITINIGGGGAPGQAPSVAGGPVDPALAAKLLASRPTDAGVTPPMLTGGMPAMPNHVSDLWANDPNLNPGNTVATRTAYGDTNRGM